VQIGLNKGEAKNSLARAVFMNRMGEIRDRSFENQRYRASGLNLVVAAIVLWNTVYLERAVQALRDSGQAVDDSLLPHLSPLGWEHINLTGDYIWQQSKVVEQGEFRPLRAFVEASRAIFSVSCAGATYTYTSYSPTKSPREVGSSSHSEFLLHDPPCHILRFSTFSNKQSSFSYRLLKSCLLVLCGAMTFTRYDIP
jgi:hypothetical protein